MTIIAGGSPFSFGWSTTQQPKVSVEEALVSHRSILERQLASLGGSLTSVVRRGRSSLRGMKVAPKYRGPGGETWAGRGSALDGRCYQGRQEGPRFSN